MSDGKTERLVEGLAFPEGPRWRDGRLWFSDMHAHQVCRVDLDGKLETIVEVENRPSGLGWNPQGDLLIVSMVDRRLLRLPAAVAGGPAAASELEEVADLSSLATWHCNDMVVDAAGRAYVGNFGFDLDARAQPVTAALVLVTPDGEARVAADDLSFPNGTVITPDGATLVVGETFAARLTAFDVAEDGSLSNRRVWAQLEGAVPDGCCLDAEGAIWVASPISREVLRVREGGEVTHRIATGQMGIACMLGGDDGRTLFLLTSHGTDPEECVQRMDARIEVARVDVPGAGLP